MPFKFTDLATQIQALESGDGKEGAWALVLGCAPVSADCPDRTQRTVYALQGGLDHFQVDLDADEADFNLKFLKKALTDKLSEVELLEKSLAEKSLRKARAAELKLAGERNERQ